MTDLMKATLLYLMPEECFYKYFLEHDIFNSACFKAVTSKGLGLGIIAGSCLVKVPQIVKIWNAKSVEGISLISVLLDLFAITFHMSYSYVRRFPFSAWGDTTFLAAQTAIIAAFILFYSGSTVKTVVFCFLYIIACYILMGGLTPIEFLWSMQALNIPVLAAGKLSQIYTNFTSGSTGQLSAVTCLMLFIGSMARIFTSVQETNDFMMILTYVVSSTLNGLVVAQLFYYWNKPSKQNKIKSKKVN